VAHEEPAADEVSLDVPETPAAKVRSTIMELAVDPQLLEDEPPPAREVEPQHPTFAAPSDFGSSPRPARPLDQDALPTIARRLHGPEDAERTAEMDGPMSPAPLDSGGLATDKTWRSDAPAGGEEFEPFTVGDLQVLAPIGRGGMGSVYRARWRGNTVAVKILAAPPDNPDVMARFEREVKTSGALDHPNIVRVFATGTMPPDPGGGPGKPYFVMDYVKGRDLAAWRHERPRSFAECVRMVVTLCQAMEHAHSRGVIHRDLKPGNVLVREGDDQPTICDFGLARYKAEAHGLTRTGDILGTPSYMPPEQALGHRAKIGPPTDVYALGALLYHLVTGKPPFLGPTAFLTIAKVIKEKPEPPRAIVPTCPEALEAAILKALAKEPIDRFHTCADLRKALERLSY
jgi:serine/threonine protein kinase